MEHWLEHEIAQWGLFYETNRLIAFINQVVEHWLEWEIAQWGLFYETNRHIALLIKLWSTGWMRNSWKEIVLWDDRLTAFVNPLVEHWLDQAIAQWELFYHRFVFVLIFPSPYYCVCSLVTFGCVVILNLQSLI